MADGDVGGQKRIMSTKTMRLPPRRVLTASSQPNNACAVAATNKRKEREDFFNKPEPSITTTTTTKLVKPDKQKLGSEPNSSNRGSKPSNELLAGYLANEFITKGTLFGKPWDPHIRGAKGPIAIETMKWKMRESGEFTAATPCWRAEQPPETAEKTYVEVASLLKEDGPHLIGVINPTQLAHMLQ